MTGELENRWQIEYRDRIMGRNATHERGYFALLRQLSLELHTLQDEFMNRPVGNSRYLLFECICQFYRTTPLAYTNNNRFAQ